MSSEESSIIDSSMDERYLDSGSMGDGEDFSNNDSEEVSKSKHNRLSRMRILSYILISLVLLLIIIICSLVFVFIFILPSQETNNFERTINESSKKQTIEISHKRNGKEVFHGHLSLPTRSSESSIHYMNPNEDNNLIQHVFVFNHEGVGGTYDPSDWTGDDGEQYQYYAHFDIYCCPPLDIFRDLDDPDIEKETPIDIFRCRKIVEEAVATVSGGSHQETVEENFRTTWPKWMNLKSDICERNEIIRKRITLFDKIEPPEYECYGFCKPRDFSDYLTEKPQVLYAMIQQFKGIDLTPSPEEEEDDDDENDDGFTEVIKKGKGGHELTLEFDLDEVEEDFDPKVFEEFEESLIQEAKEELERLYNQVTKKNCYERYLHGQYQPDDRDYEINFQYYHLILTPICKEDENLVVAGKPFEDYCIGDPEKMDCRKDIRILDMGEFLDPDDEEYTPLFT